MNRRRASVPDQPRRTIGRGAAAWLALVALLVQALLPSTIAAAQQLGGGYSLAVCGAMSGTVKDRPDAPTCPAAHCVLCLVAAVGAASVPQPAGLIPPQRRAEKAPPLPEPEATRRAAITAAQPRGPPAA